MRNIKFISYDGEYPTLCFGVLTFSVDGVVVHVANCMKSGGWLDKDYEPHKGKWSLDESYFHELDLCEIDKLTALVNENVRYGCCGGCA